MSLHDQPQPLADVLAPRLKLVFVGINPSVYSAETGFHYARPGNRFWPALHGAGITDRQLSPSEQHALIEVECGLTNIADRPTARAEELTLEELSAGMRLLATKLELYGVAHVAFLGITAYRQATGDRKASMGLGQGRLQSVPESAPAVPPQVHLLPNPSGLNAHYQLSDFVRLFKELREHVWG